MQTKKKSPNKHTFGIQTKVKNYQSFLQQQNQKKTAVNFVSPFSIHKSIYSAMKQKSQDQVNISQEKMSTKTTTKNLWNSFESESNNSLVDLGKANTFSVDKKASLVNFQSAQPTRQKSAQQFQNQKEDVGKMLNSILKSQQPSNDTQTPLFRRKVTIDSNWNSNSQVDLKEQPQEKLLKPISLQIDSDFQINTQPNQIFKESKQRLEENLKTSSGQPELQQQDVLFYSTRKGVLDILCLIKKEKQVIINDMKHLTGQMNKYKQMYEDLLLKYDSIKNKNSQLLDNQTEQNTKEGINDTYMKMVQLLVGMNVDYQQILPELDIEPSNEACQLNQLQGSETIMLQKLIIKKLVKTVEDSRKLNLLLLNRMKDQ